MCEKCKNQHQAPTSLPLARSMSGTTPGGHSGPSPAFFATPALRSEPVTPPSAETQETCHRFVIELSGEPLRIRFLDEDTSEVLLEFNDDAVREFVGDSDLALDDPNAMADTFAAMGEFTRDALGALPAPREYAATSSRQPPGKRSRRKLWDMADKLRCPIIGTCLDVADLRRMAKNGTEVDHRDMTDYEMHSCFVGAATSKNVVSLQTQKYLEKKHAIAIRRFGRAKSREQLEQLWDNALEEGEVPGAFWALCTHAKCDEQLIDRAYQEVHMLSHQIGAGQRVDLKRLAETRQKLADLEHDFDVTRSRLRQQLIDREERLTDAERNLSETATRCQQLSLANEALEQELQTLRSQTTRRTISRLEKSITLKDHEIRLLNEDRDRWQESCHDAQAVLSNLEERHEEKLAELSALESLLKPTLTDNCNGCQISDCTQCPDLGDRMVLCLGGRQQLVNHYRDLVSRSNGRFDHYDGGVEDNRNRLETMLSSADVVLCATDCVSHDAFYRMKRFCKRRDIPYVLMPSSGLSSFARALESAAGDEHEIRFRNTTQAIPLNLLRPEPVGNG